jgi:cytochrome c
MDSFEWNKIFGAVLGTALLVLGINIFVDEALKPDKPEKAAIEIAGVEAGGEHGAGTGPEAVEGPPDWGALLPAADLAAGEKVHKKCLQCHTFDKGGKAGIGPNMWGIVGAKPAHMAGFNYSSAISSKTDPWSYDNLDGYLTNPRGFAPGNKMAFAGLSKRADRVNLIAWLRQQADTPEAIPAPNPVAPPPVAPAEGAAPAEDAAPVEGAAPGTIAPVEGANPGMPGSTTPGVPGPTAPGVPGPAAPATPPPVAPTTGGH